MGLDEQIATDWLNHQLDARADKSWEPLVAVNSRTAGGLTKLGAYDLTIEEELADGLLMVYAVIGGDKQPAAYVKYTLPVESDNAE